MATPKLRFKGFLDPWRTAKFDDLAVRVSKHSNENTQLPRLEYENINSGLGTLNSKLKNNGKSGIIFKPGDVLFGKLRPYLKNWLYAGFDGVAVGDFWVLRSTGNVDPTFLYSLIQSEKYSQVANYSAGSKMPRSDWQFVSKTSFGLPITLKEQSEIGDYIAIIDQLIKVQGDRIEALKRAKNGYLQRMFKNLSESKQRLRFKGFTDDWQRVKLGDVTNVVMGQSPSSDNYTSDFNYSVLVQGNADIKNGLVKPRVFTKETTKLSEKGNIIFTVRAPVGEIAVNQFKSVVIGRGVASLSSDLDGNFLYYLLYNLNINHVWDALSAGSTFSSVNSNDIKSVSVMVPSLAEQKKIGSFLATMDDSIKLQGDKLERLKELKKGYLQHLFA